MIAQSNTIDVHSTKLLFPAYIFFGVILEESQPYRFKMKTYKNVLYWQLWFREKNVKVLYSVKRF